MEIEVLGRSKAARDLINSLVQFYTKELNLGRSRYKLTVLSVKDLAKESEVSGTVTSIGEKHLALALDSRLNITKLIETIAHEMVHVKQLARGQLKQITNRNGKSHYTWFGKKYDVNYFETPWEHEAYSRQAILANKVNRLLLTKFG